MEENNNYYYAGAMTETKRKVILMSSVVLGLLIVAGGLWWYFGPHRTGQVAENSVYQKYLPLLSDESRAKLPESFLGAYIFGVRPEVVNATVGVGTVDGGVEYTVETKTQNHPVDLYKEYLEYLNGAGWHITAQYQGSETASVVATRNSRKMVILFAADGRATKVVMKHVFSASD